MLCYLRTKTEEIIIINPASMDYMWKIIVVLNLFRFLSVPQALLSGTFLACLCKFLSLVYLKEGVPIARSHDSYFLDTQ